MPILPQELLDIIISHLHSDRRTLLTCSLLPSLHHPSRHHLFTTLPIPLHPPSLSTLSTLLLSPHNTISPHTRLILLQNTTHLLLHNPLPSILRSLRLLPLALSRLGRAGAVRLSNTDFARLPAEIPALLVRCFKGFHTIELYNLHFLRFGEVVGLLEGMGGMRRAVVKRVSWTYGFGLRRCVLSWVGDVEWSVGEMEEEDGEEFVRWLGMDPRVVVKRIEADSDAKALTRTELETSWSSA